MIKIEQILITEFPSKDGISIHDNFIKMRLINHVLMKQIVLAKSKVCLDFYGKINFFVIHVC
jgi:hypothetical protein